MLGPVIALQRLGNLCLTLGTSGSPMPGQLVRVAFPSHDVTNDHHPGDASDVADHVGQLDIHLLQRLLHTLDFRGAGPNQVVAMSYQRPQGTDIFWSAKRSME